MQLADNPDDLLEQQYRIWRKNAPYLYNVVFTQELRSPSMTAQWLPNSTVFKEDGYSINKLLYGTNLEDQPNYIVIANIKIPLQGTDAGSTKQPTIGLTQEVKEDKARVFAMIPHEGPVLRARCNPFRINQIASKSESGVVHVQDYFDYNREGKQGAAQNLQLRLTGHTSDGFGLCWNQKREGIVMSCGNDSKVLTWDLNKFEEKKRQVNASEEYKFHTKSVGDIASHFYHADVFITGDDEGQLALWDTRERAAPCIFNKKIYNGEIYTLAFNPKNEYVLAVAGSAKNITLWDMRNMTAQLFVLEGHTSDVTKIQWAPSDQSLLWSASADKRMLSWDLSEQKAKFIHAGHRSTVSDFDVSATEADTICSVEEEKILHIFQPNPAYLQS